jgi:hypothetical protein
LLPGARHDRRIIRCILSTKEEVIAAVRALGHRPADDNEADALALLLSPPAGR